MKAWNLHYIPGNPDTMRIEQLETPDDFHYVGCFTLERAATYILIQVLGCPQPIWLAERFAQRFFTERLSHVQLLNEKEVFAWLEETIPI